MKKEYREDCPEYLLGFLNHIRVIQDRTPRTEEAYYIDIRCFLRFLKIDHNDVDPNKIEFEAIEIKDVPIDYLKSFTLYDAYNYLSWLADERNNQARTRARKTTALRQFFIYLYDKAKLIDSNPVEGLELPRTAHTLPKYLSLNEAQQLLASIETRNTQRDYCIITLFLNCGMRLSELCGLDIGDISFENRTIRLFGKGRKERIVSLNNACIAALKAYLPYRNTEGTTCDALFFSAKKNRISRRRVQEIVEECLEKAGLANMGITTHKLRHTAATLMYQNGVDTLVLKNILGHESIATTEIYTHINDDNVREAIDMNPLAEISKEKK